VKKFHVVYAVWGDAFIALFQQLALPNLVAQIERLDAADRPRYSCKIYTTSGDARRLRESAPYAALAGLADVELLAMDDAAAENKYAMMAEGHRRAIAAALREKAVLIFMSPDSIWSDGMFPVLQKHAENGKRIVLLPGLRVVKEEVAPLAAKRWLSADGTRLKVSSRELIAVALEHLHGLTRSLIVNSDEFDDRWPSNLDWKVGQEGILARCFHLHPLLVDPAGLESLPTWTVDDDFICRLPRAPGDSHIVADSDEITQFDLSAAAAAPEPRRNEDVSLFRIAAWAANHATADQRRYFKEKIYFHVGERSARWEAVERESDRAVRTISLLLLARPLLFDVRAYLSRIKILRRIYLSFKTRFS
jgi:hypothetical protein